MAVRPRFVTLIFCQQLIHDGAACGTDIADYKIGRSAGRRPKRILHGLEQSIVNYHDFTLAE
jgi:hypothetical protein